MSAYVVNPDFNLQRTIEKIKVDGKDVDVVTALTVETSLPLTLTQNIAKINKPNSGCLYVPESASLRIYGDQITVSGKLSLPGRSVVILARVLKAEPDGETAPCISVNGSALPEEEAKPAALAPKQVPKEINTTGTAGRSNRAHHVHLSGETDSPGGPGWSGPEHVEAMSGSKGADGKNGNHAGFVWICCDETDFGATPTLTITAIGGPGGNGQKGQEGAQGGQGGHGHDMRATVFDYFPPTAGGNGGTGGKGGKGGTGGQGGKGGTITVHCIASKPDLRVDYKGGSAGEPGDAGEGGKGGKPGTGGASGTYTVAFGSEQTIPKAPDGQPGGRGANGDRGDPAPQSVDGMSSITTGKLENESFRKSASVSQLQMLLERVRAEYLVTEPPDYSLRRMVVASAKDLMSSGRNLIVVAWVCNGLHIRIFDASYKKVVDQVLGALASGEAITALKQQFTLTMQDVLQAGGWFSTGQLQAMSDTQQRNALIDTLSSLSVHSKAFYSTVPDPVLTGRGAILAFLLRQEILDEATLKTKTEEDLRNTLIMAIGQMTGNRGEDLWPMDHQHLVQVALEQRPGNDFVLQPSMLEWQARLNKRFQGVQAKILTNVRATVGYSDPWEQIGKQLAWLNKLTEAAASDDPHNKEDNENPQKSLAKTLHITTWAVINNYMNGLDYHGRTPAYVPDLSMDTCVQAFQESLDRMEKIEKHRNDYFASLSSQSNASSDLSAAVGKVDDQLEFVNRRLGDIRKALTKAEDEITKRDNVLKQKEPKLRATLQGFEVGVSTAFGLSANTFFNCLSQLSFINVHEPAQTLNSLAKVNGFTNAGAMAFSQVGTMLKEGIDNVLSDSGESVNKHLILDQIGVIGREVDLKTEFAKLDNGFFSSAASSRLLVELDQFRELCKQFYRTPGAAALQTELDTYIEAVVNRNRYIDSYNLSTQRLLELAGEAKKLALKKTSVAGQVPLEAVTPGLPAMATFVSGFYEHAKAICVKDLYDAYRAYAFWALEPYSGFYELIGRSPGAITASQLQSALQNMKKNIQDNLKSSRGAPGVFPAKEDKEWTMGQLVVLTRSKHAQFFEDLASGSAEFELEPATKASTAPQSDFEPTVAAWTGYTRPDFAPDGPHPFHGKADVRITKVRVWMVGMLPNGPNDKHNVTLVHLGQEQFRKRNDEPYPFRNDPASEPEQDRRDPEYVRHEAKDINFIYMSHELKYDPNSKTLKPGKLFGRVSGTTDGNLGFALEGGAAFPDQNKFAVIGPFGKWRLVVRKEDNPGLDFSHLDMIVIDFHGFHRTFEYEP